jgi:hypothetical protein
MKRKEIKQEILITLSDHLDQKMIQFDLVRSKNSLIYLKKIGDSRQEFIIEFASNPRYAPNAVAHVILKC